MLTILAFGLPLVVLGGLTVVIAGTVASILVLQSAAPRPMVINGLAGTILSYAIVAFTPVPPVAVIQVNAVAVYPVWATAAAVVAAVGWRLLRMVVPPVPTPAERDAERVRRARERAERYRRQ
jgi:hypothetical protein